MINVLLMLNILHQFSAVVLNGSVGYFWTNVCFYNTVKDKSPFIPLLRKKIRYKAFKLDPEKWHSMEFQANPGKKTSHLNKFVQQHYIPKECVDNLHVLAMFCSRFLDCT